MAIPNRQIGGSTTTNLLWQIYKQLEELICVKTGNCGDNTTTTTTTAAPGPICDTYFNITGSPFATISYTDCNGVQIVNAEVNIITSVCVTPGTVTGEVEAFEVYPNTCNP
jgi:hypothetical protein